MYLICVLREYERCHSRLLLKVVFFCFVIETPLCYVIVFNEEDTNVLIISLYLNQSFYFVLNNFSVLNSWPACIVYFFEASFIWDKFTKYPHLKFPSNDRLHSKLLVFRKILRKKWHVHAINQNADSRLPRELWQLKGRMWQNAKRMHLSKLEQRPNAFECRQNAVLAIDAHTYTSEKLKFSFNPPTNTWFIAALCIEYGNCLNIKVFKLTKRL